MELMKSSFTAEVDIQSSDAGLSPKVQLRSSGRHGKGLFAVARIGRGEKVISLSGQAMSLNTYYKLAESLRHFPHQIGLNKMIGPKSLWEVTPGDYLNHSCSPNTGFASELDVIAISDIEVGDELTIDYAFSESFSKFVMRCSCGSKDCRKIIKSSDWKIEKLIKKYSRYYQPYLKARIAHKKNTGLKLNLKKD